MTDSGSFPLEGVLGVLHGSTAQVEADLARALAAAERAPGGVGVEVRADLFPTPDEAIDLIGRLPSSLPALFTLRLARQGGRFEGDETRRIKFLRKALEQGARMVDVEWGSEAARVLTADGAPTVISHHSFDSMFDRSELERLTEAISALRPRAIKLVPTANLPEDGLRLLEWLDGTPADGPRRIGFAMGEMALFSRVLSLAHGAPFTYGAIGQSVAPGQVSLEDLLDLYRIPERTRTTRTFGVIGRPIAHSLSPHMHNAALGGLNIDAIYLPFLLERFEDVLPLVEPLGIDGLSVTIPFKENARRFAAADVDERSSHCGATNTLLFRDRGGLGAQGFNTDFDGVLGPLKRRQIQLGGLSAAILGNGGAARAAAMALVSEGATVTLYYRNPERGDPVARELAVAGRPLADLAPGNHGLIINATSAGLHPGDSSPVAADVFAPTTTAFDMIYEPRDTPFLAAAAAAGCECVPGREMLISQGLVQFQLFTGRAAEYAVFEQGFDAGRESRTAGDTNGR